MKRFAAFLLSMTFVFALAACSRNEEPVEIAVEEPFKGVTLDFKGRGIGNQELAEMVESGEIPWNTTWLNLTTTESVILVR